MTCLQGIINKNITSYTARHSFATLMKNLGASTELISELFGHSSLTVTNNYLDSFDNPTLEHFVKELSNEIKESHLKFQQK